MDKWIQSVLILVTKDRKVTRRDTRSAVAYGIKYDEYDEYLI